METSPNSPLQSAPVWPPPINAVNAELPSVYSSVYVSQKRAGKRVKVAAIIFAVVLALGAIARSQSGLPQDRQDILLGVNALFYITCLVLLAVFYLMWVSGINRNLAAFDARGIGSTPGWAVAYYFIPIVNLFRPYLDMADVWKASDPRVNSQDRTLWLRSDGSGIMKIWWLLYVLWLINGGINNHMKSVGSVLNLLTFEVSYAILGIMGLCALMRFVTLMNDRQDAKEKVLEINRAE